MKMVKRRTLLSISAFIIAVIILVSAISIRPTSASDSVKLPYSIINLSAVDEGDHLQISFGVENETNQSVVGNGTGTLTIVDSSSRVLYVGNFTFDESDFQEVSTEGKPILVLDVAYEDMKHSFAKEGTITCSLNLTSKIWIAEGTQVTIPMPQTLSVIDLFYTNAMPHDQENMMLANQIQGAVSYEPYVSQMEENGWGKVLLRSSEVWPGHPSYVLLLDKTWAANNPDLAARVVKAHMDAELWIQQALANPGSDDYNHLIDVGMQISNDSAAAVEGALKDIDFSYNLTNLSKSYVQEYVDGYIEEGLVTNQSLRNMSYKNSEDFANSYLDTTYLSKALSVSPSNTILGSVSMGFVKGNIFMLPTYIALDQSVWGGETAFEKYGVNVVSPEPKGYNTSALVTRELIMGNINAGFTGICPAILLRINNGMNTIMAAQMTANGTALVVQNNIDSLEDLAGKTIAGVDPVTIQNVFLLYLADEYGFNLIPVDQGGVNSTENQLA